MSSDLKEILDAVVVENSERERTEFEEALNRFKTILLKIRNEKKLDVLIFIEGIEQQNTSKLADDLKVLERARLVAGQTKYTHRNAYRQYTLTAKGVNLSEKLAQEKIVQPSQI